MIEKGVIKLGQVVLIYSIPPEEALIGAVDSIEYPIITIETIQRDSKEYDKFEKVDLLTTSLSVLTDEFISNYLTPKEKKRLKKIEKDSELVDLFAGEY